MFKHAVTMTHDLTDATLALTIMLSGAFLLGCLFFWAFSSGKRTKKAKET